MTHQQAPLQGMIMVYLSSVSLLCFLCGLCKENPLYLGVLCVMRYALRDVV